MKLKTVQVCEFQSIRDSNLFEIGDITCLVGKNEAGKTAILKALYCLNPIQSSDGNFVITDDYPRAEVEDYRQEIESGKRGDAIVVKATYALDEDDLKPIYTELGKEALSKWLQLSIR